MVQTPAIETKNCKIELPYNLKLQVSPEQFTALAVVNRDLRLERAATGELIVNPPTGWETGERNGNIFGELYIWNVKGENLVRFLILPQALLYLTGRCALPMFLGLVKKIGKN